MVLNWYRTLASLALWASLALACGKERPPEARPRPDVQAETRPEARPGPGAASEPGSATGASDSDWKALYDRWQYPQPIPDFALTDHNGKRFGLGRLERDHVLIGFIYTRCPVAEACPLTTQKMRQVQKRWHERVARGEHQGKSLTLLAITLDPDFDTPERLRQYAEARGLDLDTWILATGPRELVQNALPSMFNVLALPRGGDIQHTVKAALLRPGLIPDREWADDELSADQVIDTILHPAAKSN